MNSSKNRVNSVGIREELRFFFPFRCGIIVLYSFVCNVIWRPMTSHCCCVGLLIWFVRIFYLFLVREREREGKRIVCHHHHHYDCRCHCATIPGIDDDNDDLHSSSHAQAQYQAELMMLYVWVNSIYIPRQYQ